MLTSGHSEHLTEREVEKLIEATSGNRWGQRDSTMILLTFRHGLRASEVCGLPNCGYGPRAR
jgi:site-specific recombinase XerD